MRIYSLSRILALPFVVILAVLGYLEFFAYWNIGWWLLPPLMAIVALIILHGNIDYWWHKKHPIPLAEPEKKLMAEMVPYYNALSVDKKQKFEDRVSLYTGAREWKNVGTSELKEIPYDIKVLIASQVVQLTFNDDDFLLGDFDRVYTYKHPFPSPRFKFLHTMETNVEDGMIILAMEYLIPGITKPKQFYNITMHAYAEAYVKQYPSKNYPNTDDIDWNDISAISGFSREQILGVLGYEEVDILPLAISLYFTRGEAFKQQLPSHYSYFSSLFGNIS